MTYVVNIKNVLNEDTGEVGVVHVVVASEREGKALIAEFLRDEDDLDPTDFTLVTAPDDWDCVAHGDGAFCTAPLLN